MASFTLLLGLAVYYGAVVVLPPSSELMTAHLIDSVHGNAQVDGSVLPPSILVDLYHEKPLLSRLGRLKYVFYAGGPLPQDVGDGISKVTHLSTAFGSTETAFPPQELIESEYWDYVCYSPFCGNIFRPLHEDGLHEQFIVRRRELDLFQGVFSTYPDTDEFSTKDLYRQHPTQPNLWKFCGRTDDVIVFSSAEKFNPVDFESALMAHPSIKTAIVGGHGKFQPCLLIEPGEVDKNGYDNSSLLNHIWPIVLEASRACPAHAKVMKDFILFTDETKGVERAGKGTVQRMMTLQLYEEEINRLYEMPELPNRSPELLTGTEFQNSETLRDALYRLVSACTWLKGELTFDSNLFALGLDSLQTISLSKQINSYLMQAQPSTKPITPQTIYAHSSIQSLEHALQNVVDPSSNESQRMEAIFDEYSANFVQGEPISPSSPSSDLVVLLTGSTGSLGSYILDTLLSCGKVQKIYCMNRNENGESRQATSSKSKGLTTQFQIVTFVHGDLSKPGLGIDEGTFVSLLQEVTHVIHNAWDVNFYHSLEAFVTPHISGVRHLIDFCNKSACNAQLLFVSTESTVRNKRQLEHATIHEDFSQNWASCQTTGYAQSKLIAERLIETASHSTNLSSTVCRVGQISGPTNEYGCWSLSEWFPSLVASSVHMGKLPDSLSFMDLIDWVPVNLVAQIVVELLFGSEESLKLQNGGLSDSNSSGVACDSTSDSQSPVQSQVSKDSKNHSNPIPALDEAAHTPIAIENGIDHSTPTGTSKVYQVVNPRTTTWRHLNPSFREHCTTSLQLTPFPDWLEALEQSAESESNIAKLPAIRLLDFFKQFLEPVSGPLPVLGTSETQKHSTTLEKLTPVGEQWVGIWMRQWGFGE
ncbi:non-canonical non-ribosomal peptide synthetase FUB8 [Physcia stellaris]|nr:non-canonical non-ribosomal peptide synthetase FUB8 [Physcia stellaris]